MGYLSIYTLCMLHHERVYVYECIDGCVCECEYRLMVMKNDKKKKKFVSHMHD